MLVVCLQQLQSSYRICSVSHKSWLIFPIRQHGVSTWMTTTTFCSSQIMINEAAICHVMSKIFHNAITKCSWSISTITTVKSALLSNDVWGWLWTTHPPPIKLLAEYCSLQSCCFLKSQYELDLPDYLYYIHFWRTCSRGKKYQRSQKLKVINVVSV